MLTISFRSFSIFQLGHFDSLLDYTKWVSTDNYLLAGFRTRLGWPRIFTPVNRGVISLLQCSLSGLLLVFDELGAPVDSLGIPVLPSGLLVLSQCSMVLRNFCDRHRGRHFEVVFNRYMITCFVCCRCKGVNLSHYERGV